MKDFLELLVNKYGFPDFVANKIMFSFYILSGILIVYTFIKYVVKKIREYFIRKYVSKDLHPYFTYQEVYKYTRFYIPQYFQNITPSEGEELGRIHAAAAKSKLMPMFINKGLLHESPVKYFMILSDTGMGKTAFMINLFRKYKQSKKRLKHTDYDIKFIPLGSQDALQKIKEIEQKRDTILLLDAFDEDVKAVQNYKARMNELLEEVKDFRKVIFTCRTQFFPSKEEEPTDTNDITFGDNIKHSIQKLYLSAFDDRDIIKYLIKKFGFNLFNFIPAYKLVKKSPSLMFRPMLLSYIDDLIADQFFYTYTFEMYKVLINNWIKRESSKPAVLARYDGERYSKNLLLFSQQLAKNLYTERDNRNGYVITISELRKVFQNLSYTESFITLDDSTGRSLLNRNSIGQFKFAHKSILEYFLAVEIFKDSDFLINFDFQGMDATYNFLNEMLARLLKDLTGKIKLILENKPKSLNTIIPTNVPIIDTLILQKCTDIEFKNLAGLLSVKLIICTDPDFLLYYCLYINICLQNRINSQIQHQPWMKPYELFIEPYSSIISEIKSARPVVDISQLKELFNYIDIDEKIKKEIIELLNTEDNIPLTQKDVAFLMVIKTTFLNNRSEKVLIMDAHKNCMRINKLSKYLPLAEFIY